MLWFSINLFILLIFILLYIVIKKKDKKWSKINDYLGKVTNTVNSVRYGNLAAKIENLEHSSYQNLSESINRMVETLNDREKMIVEYQGELTRQNKFLEAVINSLSDGILIIDEHDKILRATPKIAQWFKEEGKSLMGKNVWDYIQITDNTKPEKLENSEIFIKNNPSASFEADSMKLSLDDKKKRLIILIKDITNQKELEKLREDFVATLTHDLKVPIVAEANILDFLIKGKFGEISEKQFEAISNMKTCNQELVDLVQLLLETYKVSEAGIDLDKEKIELVPYLTHIIDEMRPIAEKSELKINFAPKKEMTIHADYMHMKRVFKNLIQNAISHSNSNSDIDITIGSIPHFTTICVIDHGKGIAQENLDKVFNKYYSTAKKFRKIGTGLGLYLAQQIVQSHGGEIIVTSVEDVDTTFCVKLPA